MTSPTAAVLGKIGLPLPIKELAARHWDVIIVGAGHNGLACATYLAQAGNACWSWKAVNASAAPAQLKSRFPAYSCRLALISPGCCIPLVVRELNLPERGFRWTPAVNGLFVPFLDGSSIQLWDDDDACEAEIRRYAQGDVEGWRAMSDVIRRLRDACGRMETAIFG